MSNSQLLSDEHDFRIYYEAEQEGCWFKSLSKCLSSAQMIRMKPYGQNPRIVDELISYDTPDVIFSEHGKPLMVLEKTEEVPTGHNVGQRFARLVRGAELGVPVIYFFPHAAMKHGRYANPCWVNARLFDAMFRVWDIHGVPFMAVDWPHDSHYELLRNGIQDKVMKDLINEFVESTFDLGKSNLVKKIRSTMEKAKSEAIERNQGYEDPPHSVRVINTEDFLQSARTKLKNVELPAYFAKRDHALVYEIGMTEENCRREDPYTGMQLIYDYAYCRTGPTKLDRTTDLVLDFPYIRKEIWLRKNPYQAEKKRRLWYIIPDLLVFKDGIINPERVINQGNRKLV